jgi:hypothetical protein
MNDAERHSVQLALRVIEILADRQEGLTPVSDSERRGAKERMEALLLAEDCLRDSLSIPECLTREDLLRETDEPRGVGGRRGKPDRPGRIRRMILAERELKRKEKVHGQPQ